MNTELFLKYAPGLLEGLIVTIEIVSISVAIGMLLALPIAAARLSRNRILRAVSFAYVYFFRGTPLLAQLFLIYYGAGEIAAQYQQELKALGLWVYFRDAFYYVIVAFALNTAAYEAEIFRGAIRSVARGQWEAGAALGLHRLPLWWKVVLPQAATVALRPVGNDIILLIKGSAIASIVSVLDLLGETRLPFSRTYDLKFYFYAAILYLILVETIRRLWNAMERRLTRHLRRGAEAKTAATADLAPAMR
jgi:polar amino acid transport system permease protein